MTRNAPEQGYIPFEQSKHQFATTVHLPSQGFPLAPASQNAELGFLVQLKHIIFAFYNNIIICNKLSDSALLKQTNYGLHLRPWDVMQTRE